MPSKSLFANIIDEAEQVSLTDDMVHSICGCPVVLYYTLRNYNNIDELLDDKANNKNKSLVLLYPINSVNSGHYVAILDYREKGYIEIFDSYALRQVDAQLDHIENPDMKENAERLLARLLNNSNYEVVLNPVRLQEYSENINTCGRHCSFRICFRNTFEIEDYIKMVKASKYSPDDLVCLTTILFTI